MKHNTIGLYSIMTFNMMIWGLNAVALKILVTHFPAVTMQGVRIFLAGLVLLLYIVIKRTWKPLTKRDWGWTIGIILTGVVGHHLFLAWGLTITTASNAALILSLVPLMTAFLSFLFLREHITPARMGGILLGLIGVILVVLRGGTGLSTSMWGDLLIGGAMIFQACSFILIKKATDTIDAKQLTTIMFLAGATLIFLIGLFISPDGVSIMLEGPLWVWAVLIVSGVVATAWGHAMYNATIHQLGPGQTAVFINLTPFFALVGSALFLGEAIQWVQIAGFALIIVGVFLGTGAWGEGERMKARTVHRETGIH
ncbi:DMT family transporter [Desmospora activa]|uniref:EamA domain-containing membrane protein RarD n=1 Tax=Desmospora activa DSM 45169 TaxID=1121389 RepID=A0A2T4Z0L4_9BACL|nr:DMT family transporter [Desmospora activa]PTM53265.1 EamA domain-containing membrane protein RarD [Desmospora activa DSM 45169]